jgi:branched-subunit amino acid ABC-type transport system permease component
LSTFIELVVNGVSAGSVYALIALGFVIIFKATEVVNFAHASLLLAGGYVTAVLHDDIGFLPALGAGIAAAAARARWWSCWCCGAPGRRTAPSWRSSRSASTSC